MKSKAKTLVLAGFMLTACASDRPKENVSPVVSKAPVQRSMAAVNPQNFLYEFQIDREAGERYRPEDNMESEQKEYQRLIDLFSAHFKNKYGTAAARGSHQDQGESGYALRGVHAKGHGCLAGTFIVDNHGRPEFQHGVFREPKTHEIVIRYSNGDGPPQRDGDNTVSIGMAFKLLDVKDKKLLGEQQTEDSVDFLMTNHPNFVVRDIREFAEVIEGRENGLLDKIGAIKVAARGLYERLKVTKKDPLVTPYWSNLPFKMGEGVVKYLVRPEACHGERDSGEIQVSRITRFNSDFLTKTLTEHIRKHSACFGFYLQKKGTDQESPVEDASVSWPEKGFVTRVGTLQIPSQEPNENLTRVKSLNGSGLTGKQICQHLSFSPWNTTADFKPLSSLNRARRVIYELSTAMRRDLNYSTNPAQGRK